ncbi:cache domain-containing protein [Pantanalinema sp. GBBB05]|uniref:cache domain-containing protein n=1 Tax=Pantanalinema sp. GBBB05 TaxID=2604139 RepID=UPI001E0BEA45|nr:HAMP domain-containing protein [Pantanalinema sp. GBBB05]
METAQRVTRTALRQFRLRTTLVVPFVVQIVAAVSLVGWLSFRSGQQAVTDLAHQLRSEVTARVRDRIRIYVSVPPLVNRVNADAIDLGILDFQNIPAAEPYFWRQVLTYQAIGYVGFANEQGQYSRVGWINRWSPAERPQVAEQLSFGTGNLDLYDLDQNGNRVRFAKSIPNYDVRKRPFYTAILGSQKPAWSEIFINVTNPTLQMNATHPYYDRDGNLLGILTCQMSLNQIRDFLSTLKIGRTGQVYIVEPTGNLVSTSLKDQPLWKKVKSDLVRVRAIDSQNPLMQSSFAFLSRQFNKLESIQQDYQLEFFTPDGQRQFLQVSPFTDKHGLTWLIVVAMPESDFMQQIINNTRTTVLLCLLALAAAIVGGYYVARWISGKILRLDQAAQAVANGDFDQSVQVTGGIASVIELENLAGSFNSMTRQLKTSFESLEHQRNSFARFFPPEYLKFLKKADVTHVELGDHASKEMAVMFSDIRSFTPMAEQMTPQESFNFINAYLGRVSPEIRNYNGFVVKFMGDGMMAVFPDRADDAVQAGIAQFRQLRQYNQEREAQGLLPIAIGMGLHFGHVMVGMVGENNRVQGDTLSDNVNLTSRLEGLTKFYGVSLLISADLLQRLADPDRYLLRFLDRVIVKGRSEAIAIYEVLEADVETNRQLKLQTLAEFKQGVQHYRDGNWLAARQCFEQVLTINPLDKTASLYLQRIAQLREQGIPANWNGVWTFTEK